MWRNWRKELLALIPAFSPEEKVSRIPAVGDVCDARRRSTNRYEG